MNRKHNSKKGKRGKKPAKEVKRKNPVRVEGTSARMIAVEILSRHKNRMEFGALANEVASKLAKLQGKKELTWTPTYYLKSPGFSRPERGIVAYNPSEAKNAQAERTKARVAQGKKLAKARKPAKKPKAKPAKPKAPKKIVSVHRGKKLGKELEALQPAPTETPEATK